MIYLYFLKLNNLFPQVSLVDFYLIKIFNLKKIYFLFNKIYIFYLIKYIF